MPLVLCPLTLEYVEIDSMGYGEIRPVCVSVSSGARVTLMRLANVSSDPSSLE